MIISVYRSIYLYIYSKHNNDIRKVMTRIILLRLWSFYFVLLFEGALAEHSKWTLCLHLKFNIVCFSFFCHYNVWWLKRAELLNSHFAVSQTPAADLTPASVRRDWLTSVSSSAVSIQTNPNKCIYIKCFLIKRHIKMAKWQLLKPSIKNISCKTYRFIS